MAYQYVKTDGSLGTTNDQANAPGIAPHSGFQAISATSLQTPVTPAQIPTAPVPTDPTPHVASGAAILGANGAAIAPPAPTAAADTSPQDLFSKYISSLPKPPSSADTYAADYAASGVDPAQADLNQKNAAVKAAQSKLAATNASIAGITAKAQQMNLMQEGRQAPVSAIQGQQAENNRQSAIQAIPLQVQALANQAEVASAQGDAALSQSILEQAKTHLDTMFKIHSDDAQAQYKFNTDLITAVYNFADEQQKAKLDLAKTKQAQDFSLLQNSIKTASDYAKTALASGQTDLASQILALDPKSSTYSQDVSRLEGQVKDRSAQLDIQYKQAQIAKMNADARAAVAADAAVTPDVLNGMLNVYKSTGVLPAFGLSAKSPLRAQFYAALGAEGGGQIVNDANANKTIRAGLTTAYKTQQNQYSANQTAIATLGKQLDLAQQYSDQVDRMGSPLVNKYLLAAKSGVFGDPQTAALHNIVTTASYELAKVISGSAASISGVTVSSAADATNLLNSAMSKGQFTEVLGLMKREADFRLQSQKDTLGQLQDDLSNVGKLSDNLTQATTSSSYQTSVFDNLFKQYGGH